MVGRSGRKDAAYPHFPDYTSFPGVTHLNGIQVETLGDVLACINSNLTLGRAANILYICASLKTR